MLENLGWKKEPFYISTDKKLLQIPRIHHFLSTQAYWSLGIPLEIVKKSIAGSLSFGVFTKETPEDLQVGYARIVSDFASFAWLCDVYVEEPYRNKGLSKWLMECVMSHPDLKNLRRICLATKDAHDLYKQYGFKMTETPQNWMEIKDNDIYKKLKDQNG